jgi:tetratricopeptide (TPR) repeat protein
VATSLGSAYALAGRLDEALPILEAAVTQAAARSIVVGQGMRMANWGEGCLLAGRLDEAMTHAEEALGLVRKHGERGHEGWALWLLGEVHASRTPLAREEAEAAFRGALAIAEQLAMRPLAARCHLGLHEVARHTGNEAAAQTHLGRSLELFRELDMRFWLWEADLRQSASSDQRERGSSRSGPPEGQAAQR